jgi:Ca-activated chloride channel homolog
VTRRTYAVVRALVAWGMVVAIGTGVALASFVYLAGEAGKEPLQFRDPDAWYLMCAPLVAGVIAFHFQRGRAAALGYSQVGLIRSRGTFALLSDLPGALRVVALGAVVVALARPETERTLIHETEQVDIMIVFDMSKSMEETDLPRDRMDAAQRVVRRFLRTTRHDRVGLVIFGQQAMLHTPLNSDMKLLEQTVADLAIGDVPELGTAIGDGLAMALAALRRSDGLCDPAPGKPNRCPAEFTCSEKGTCTSKKRNKVVILLSDGDNNWVTRFTPDEAAKSAAEMGVKVYTILVGREDRDIFGAMSANPATLKSIAEVTGGEFFRATDYESFDRGFRSVRAQLDKVKRTKSEKVPDKQLFAMLLVIAGVLLGLEIVLTHTVMRRLP